ncbi:MAG TPA: histidine kinase, partial [Leptospiraceae bacterium]|nr:histidine kinase [Leptospiraceae bacterium]
MKNKTILLVEDDRSISLTETKQLQKYGYLVIQAFSGQMAVDLMFGGQKIDLILMGIDLGSNMMDGT